jgi:regulator of cell morphogenesis and NO signaling
MLVPRPPAAPPDPDSEVDPRALSTADLTTHIVARHHAYLREALPALRALAAHVAQLHGSHQPALRDLANTVDELAAMFLPHLLIEERIVFPALLDDATDRAVIARELDGMSDEHLTLARLFDRMRVDSSEYWVPDWACGSYRRLFTELQAVEADTWMHVHLENRVLKPRFRQR